LNQNLVRPSGAGRLNWNELLMESIKTEPMRFSLIVAHDQNLGIGKHNQLPWRIADDLKHFRKITTSVKGNGLTNAVIMGRKTWDSIPLKQRPLTNRQNIVLTRNESFTLTEPDVLVVKNLEEAIAKVKQLPCENCFVIGGAEVYRQALALSNCFRLYTTEVMGNFDCDVFFPPYSPFFSLVERSDWMHDASHTFRFCTYEKN
jgi:dihydrofolate reductase/thymidylate synthase